ncbi:alpha-ribazole phosphatase [Fontibacillus phaseoli]|uniref:Alpha-ribazole phosphatase n=1 Tax=Fontibacillus phaseoli TaxID=1416533 RepID=A0A369BIH5_9BACL|nr:histidine phosphatase family protein [Fontibacillus phaseoli]RCX20376.1 alpha-ribazole phosphatase [Fontibacillus phaseoli]
MEWWLIRHGMTEWNKERRYQGHSDTKLLPGEACGLSPLRAELAETAFSAVFCSDLKRCRSTLEYISPELAAVASYDSRLREMNFGAWEGQTYEMLKNNPQYRNWIDNPQEVTPPGGEAWPAFEDRIKEIYAELDAFSRKLVTERVEEPILIVTHGGVISILGTILEPGSEGLWNAKWKVEPGKVLRITHKQEFNSMG